MTKMVDLKTTTEIVRSILEQDRQCRNSDSLLYLKVLWVYAAAFQVDLDKISLPLFLMEYYGKNFPVFETVRRTRQKLQQHHPELAACEAVQEARAENEAQFKAYALGDV
jgi:hypothetical protein